MKLIKTFALILSSLFLFNACFFDDPYGPGNSGDGLQFVAAYSPIDGTGELGDKYCTALMTVDGGVTTVSKLSDYYVHTNYPYSELYKQGDFGSNDFVMALSGDFNIYEKEVQGLYYNVEEDRSIILPLLQPEHEDDYPYFQRGSPRISKNGFVFYLSASNNKYYGDTYKAKLVRYDTDDEDYLVAIDPTAS